MTPVFESLEVVITLRCNLSCRNCIRLCNSTVTTGLDYVGLDMALADVRRIIGDISDVYESTGQQVLGTLCLTGGEPTMHPELESMLALCRALLPPYMVGELVVNVNRTRPVPASVEPYVVHWWSPEEKAQLHQCALVSPTDPPPGFPHQGGRTWDTCEHYRKHRLVATVHGYGLCCAAEGYTRLLHVPELLVGKLPASLDGFPRPDPVCQHCAFGAPVAILERDHGRPVSRVFDESAHLNRKGRRMPEKLRGER